MLRLASRTDPGWAARLLPRLGELLVDHAHLEKKAAATAVNLLFRYPDRPTLQRPLASLAREELTHFEAVLAVLERRGIPFRRQRASPYFGRLHAEVRHEEPGRLLDLLLCAALIEARSCERLGLLADALAGDELQDFFRSLLEAEARHHGIYLELARQVAGRPAADARLRALSSHEAHVLALAPDQARLHDGGAGGPAPRSGEEDP